MEIPVTLVPSIDAQAWPNEIYVGYATGWMRRYDQEFDPDRSTSGRLPPARARLCRLACPRTCSLAKARTGRKNPAQQKTIVLADDRRMADRAMKSCDRVLNALASTHLLRSAGARASIYGFSWREPREASLFFVPMRRTDRRQGLNNKSFFY